MTRSTESPVLDRRRLGVLLHPTSLPPEGTRGVLGADARRFVDLLASLGASVWQVLPLGPPGGRSPYNGRSAHAGDPDLISLYDLATWGWLSFEQATAGSADDGARRQSLRLAYKGFLDTASQDDRSGFSAFKTGHAQWLPDYSLYCCLKANHNGAPWWEWHKGGRDRDTAILGELKESADYDYYGFEQFVFFRQWRALRDYAHEHGVRLFGDMPIFVAEDSAEVWAHAELFVLDAHGRPEVVTGVPPDYFSAEGQRWGNPHYRWQRMEADGFSWWRERVRTQMELFDLIRIDHFRGFEAAWTIPFSHENAIGGRWVPVPGEALLLALRQAFGELPFVAEDLGLITEPVVALRERYRLPGMRVLQFGFDGDPSNPHLPHNYLPNSVAYTGTHDNDTTVGWYQSLASSEKGRVDEYLGPMGADPHWSLIRAVLASVSYLAVLPWQDLLGLGSNHRMNTPGKVTGNWNFRFAWADVPRDMAGRVQRMAALYGRLPSDGKGVS